MTSITAYDHRDKRFFKDESKGDFVKRMRRAELYGWDEKAEPLKLMMAELLVFKNATVFANALNRLGLKFRVTRGIGADSFFIEG